MSARFKGRSRVWSTRNGRIGIIVGLAVSGLWAVGGVLAALGSGDWASITSGLAMFVLLLLGAAWRSTITVTIEGIYVTWLGDSRFIPMTEIAEATRVSPREILLQSPRGATFTLYTAKHEEGPDALLDEIHRVLDAARAAGPKRDVSAIVARGARTHAAWLADLDQLGRSLGAGGYRAQVIEREDLFRLVEDPSASDDARAGAAIALKASADAAARERIRIASETASPKLRVALETEDDTELLRAVEEMSEDEAAQKAR